MIGYKFIDIAVFKVVIVNFKSSVSLGLFWPLQFHDSVINFSINPY